MTAREPIYEILMRAEDIARRRPISKQLRFLRRAQWWSVEETARYRDARVAALVRHAYETTPFYRVRMDDAGVRPDDITSVAELVRLPVLTRQELHAHGTEMLSSAFRPSTLERGCSSGSTGEPVCYWHDPVSIGAGLAAERWGWETAGWRAGDRAALVWGNPDTVRQEWSRLGPRVKSLLFRELRIPAYTITNVTVADEALDAIERFSPEWLRGYANAIAFLATRAAHQGRPMPRCRGVLPMAEGLQPTARQAIEDVFGPVHDGYGSSEMGGIAYECPAGGGYHIVEPHVVVEFGAEDLSGDGARELIVTNLDERGMPLLRYRIGDLAVPADEPCPCGRPWASLRAVYGRRTDLIETPHGGVLLSPGGFMRIVVRQSPAVTRMQLAKVSARLLEMRLVADEPISDDTLAALASELRPHLGGLEVRVVQRDSLPVSPAGKHRLVVDETVPGAAGDIAI